jgi:hypothetical protein
VFDRKALLCVCLCVDDMYQHTYLSCIMLSDLTPLPQLSIQEDKCGVMPDLLMKILAIIDAIFTSDEKRASFARDNTTNPLILLTGPGIATLLEHFERRFQSGSWASSSLSSKKLRQHELKVLSRVCDYVGEKRDMLNLNGAIE